MLHTKVVREEVFFFKVFPIISLWELYVAKLTRVPIQTAQKPDATVSLCLMMLFMKFDQNWPGF